MVRHLTQGMKYSFLGFLLPKVADSSEGCPLNKSAACRARGLVWACGKGVPTSQGPIMAGKFSRPPAMRWNFLSKFDLRFG